MDEFTRRQPVRRSEYRVTWKRAGWKRSRVHIFQQGAAARTFMAKQDRATEVYGLTGIVEMSLDARRVDPWKPVD